MTANEINVRSYERKHTLWQAIAEGSEIIVHRGLDKSLTVGLNSHGFRLATETIYFATYKARDAAMDAAANTGRLSVIAGTTRQPGYRPSYITNTRNN